MIRLEDAYNSTENDLKENKNPRIRILIFVGLGVVLLVALVGTALWLWG